MINSDFVQIEMKLNWMHNTRVAYAVYVLFQVILIYNKPAIKLCDPNNLEYTTNVYCCVTLCLFWLLNELCDFQF